MNNDPDRLLSLAQAVADGHGLDWTALDSGKYGDEDLELIRQLQLLAGVAAASRSTETGEQTAAEKPLDILHWGPLEIRRSLGTGGFGQVFLAWDPQLAREVALKLIPSEQVNVKHAPTVVHEGQLLARVRHPNVITVYGADHLDNQIGIWMELIRGRTLEALIRLQGPLSDREAAAVGVVLCSALAAVHNAHLLHRDIKAQNVMREDGGRIVLMDFGAGQDDASGTGRPRSIGTPAYMAPELFLEQRASRQSDVYSLGVLLFRLVTGEYPVPGAGMQEIRRAHAQGSRRSLADLRPELSSRFVQTVERALAVEPDRRFATAGEMGLALGELAGKTPVVVTSRGAKRVALTAGAIVAALAIAVATGVPSVRHRLAAAIGLAHVTNVAVLPFVNTAPAMGTEYFAYGVTEILMSRLGAVEEIRVMARSSIDTLPAGERNAKAAGARLGAAFVVEGSVEQGPQRVRVTARLVDASTGGIRWTQTYDRPAGDLFSIEGEIATAISAEIGIRLTGDARRRLLASQTSSAAAQDEYLRGRYLIYTFDRTRFEEARQHLERAVELDPNYAIAHASLARVYGLLLDADLAPAATFVPKAKGAALRAVSIDPDLAETNVALGDVKYKYEHDWDAANALFARAVQLSPNASLVRSPYARVLCAQGRLDEALAEATAGGLADPLSAEMAATIGVVHYYRRDFRRAHEFYAQAARLNPSYGPAHFGDGRTYSAEGNYLAAIDHIRQAMALVGENPTFRAELARNYFLGGWRDASDQILGGLLEQAADPSMDASYEGIGYVFAARGDHVRAFEFLNKSLDHYFARLLYIKVDPRADPLRDDPAFAELLARIGLSK